MKMTFSAENLYEEFKKMTQEAEEQLKKQIKEEEERLLVSFKEYSERILSGETLVKVGYDSGNEFGGVFVKDDLFSNEEIRTLEMLNSKIISLLKAIFRKTDELKCVKMIKDALPTLDEGDVLAAIDTTQRIIKNSRYANKDNVLKDVEYIFQLRKLIAYISKEFEDEKDALYKFDIIRQKYRQLQMKYRCEMLIQEQQEKLKGIYGSRHNEEAFQFVAWETIHEAEDEKRRFALRMLATNTSELREFVIHVNEKGYVNSNELEVLVNKISEYL